MVLLSATSYFLTCADLPQIAQLYSVVELQSARTVVFSTSVRHPIFPQNVVSCFDLHFYVLEFTRSSVMSTYLGFRFSSGTPL